jgi:hypothetical protein
MAKTIEKSEKFNETKSLLTKPNYGQTPSLKVSKVDTALETSPNRKAKKEDKTVKIVIDN